MGGATACVRDPGPALLAIVSITLSWYLVVLGALIFLGTTIRWIGDTRRGRCDNHPVTTRGVHWWNGDPRTRLRRYERTRRFDIAEP